MREVPVPSAVRGASFFLISYSHTEYYGQGNAREPDYWVIKFYKDLSRNIEELAAIPPGGGVGVLDRDLWVEDDWLEGLPERARLVPRPRAALHATLLPERRLR